MMHGGNHLPTPETKIYEAKLNSFKVNELQAILTHFKVQKIGKKHELLTRCIEVLRNPAHTKGCIDKIRELDMRMTVRPAPYPMGLAGGAAAGYAQAQHGIYGRAGAMPTMGGYGGMPGASGVYGGAYGAPSMSGGGSQQQQLTPRPARNLTPQPLPFYDPVFTLLDPQELPPSPSGMKSNAAITVTFSLAADHHMRLQTRPDVFPRTEVQLRFFNTTGDILNIEQPDDFPLNCNVKINETQVTLPNVIPTNKPNVEPKRPSRPVNITQYITSQAREKIHRMKIDWAADKRSWAVAIYLVSRVDAEILKKRVESSPSFELPYETTEASIRRRLGGGDDDDVAMDALKISLLCPLGKTRMKIAARSRDCQHIQCFDLDLYLQMNEKRPTWKCCVCSQNAPYHKLVIDKYFMKMLADLAQTVTDVELLRDGKWKVIKEEDICDISDDDEDADVKPKVACGSGSAPGSAPLAAKGAAAAAASNDVIILSDDDEDDVSLRIAIRASMPSSVSEAEQEKERKWTSASAGGSSSAPVRATPLQSSSTVSPSSDDSIIVLDDTPPRPTLAARSMAAPASSAVSINLFPSPSSSSTAPPPTSPSSSAAAPASAAPSSFLATPSTTGGVYPTLATRMEQHQLQAAGVRPNAPPSLNISGMQQLQQQLQHHHMQQPQPMSAAAAAQNLFNWAQQPQPQSAPPMPNHWAQQQQQQYQMHMQQQQQYAGFYGMPQQGYYGGGTWAAPNAPTPQQQQPPPPTGGYNGGNGVIRRPDDPR